VVQKEKRDLDLSLVSQNQPCTVDVVMWIGETTWSVVQCVTLYNGVGVDIQVDKFVEKDDSWE
jgi:hypothetical protein